MKEPNLPRHITVVGGPGAMGRHAVRQVVGLENVATIVLADIDLEKAERFAAEIGPRATAAHLDARDTQRLDELFSQTDIVVNVMGPFAVFGKAILQAAIRNGCHYIDIDDDWEATVEAFELDAEAKAAGVTALIGMGMSPGVTNLLAVVAAGELDSVARIYTGWSLSGTGSVHEPEYDSSGGTAAVAHWILQCSGQVEAWRNGKRTMVTPLEARSIDFPNVGIQKVYSVGHPEPVTLPRKFPGLQESLNLMSGPDWMFDAVREIAAKFDTGTISLDEAVAAVGRIERPKDPAATPREQLPGGWALAEGTKDGQPARASAHLSAHPPFKMGGSTGYPLAVGIGMLIDGLVTETGVVTPEEVIDPAAFFDRLALITEPARESASALVVLGK